MKKLIAAGARLFQYRNKTEASRGLMQAAQSLCATAHEGNATFILNDRPDIARLVWANGVHVGQEDLDVSASRAIVGPESLVGVSTHNLDQLQAAAQTDADYLAFGPVFRTQTKAKADPVVGLELLREARGLTSKPIVAIGGITLQNAREVLQAGADSVAVISDIWTARNPVARVKQYLEVLPSAAQPAGN